MHSLLAAPAPLRRLERSLVAVTAAFVALTRLLALSRSMWDWDEAQFASALRDYDVAVHHPHPPGFPLFVLAARVVRFLVPSDFGALQTVNLVAACALFPLAFLLARECRFDFPTSFSAALVFVFLPNIWFYGGTAFSDIAALAALLGALVLILRGCRRDGAFVAGVALLGVAAGIRSQSLLFAVVPFLMAARCQAARSWRRLLAAVALAAAIAGCSYAGAAIASSSLEGYSASVRGVGAWVRAHDAFTATGRPPLRTLVDDYVTTPMGGRKFAFLLSGIAAIGLLGGLWRSARSTLLVISMFAPFMIFAWLMLDPNSIHRYSTAYVYLHAVLIAEAAALTALPFGGWRDRLCVAGAAAVALGSAAWTWPAIAEVRSTDSPTWASMRWITRHVPAGGRVWIDGSMRPFADYALSGRDARIVSGTDEIPLDAYGEFFVTEGFVSGEGVQRFVRPRAKSWKIARRRWFEVSVVSVSSMIRFGAGWWGEEGAPGSTWRWMAGRSVTLLRPTPGRGRLRMRVAAQSLDRPELEVRFNGRVIDRFRPTADGVTREWVVPSRRDALNQLVMTSDRVVNLARRGVSADGRDLSVRIDALSWQPVR